MKNIADMQFPEDRRYSESHEWALPVEGGFRIGICEYAQDQLGDIVFVEVPAVGAEFARGDSFGSVESVKAVSELYLPVGGRVTAVNPELEGAPELVNAQPYAGGWILEIAPSDPAEWDALLAAGAYAARLKGTE